MFFSLSLLMALQKSAATAALLQLPRCFGVRKNASWLDYGALCIWLFVRKHLFWSRALLDACFRASSSIRPVFSRLNSVLIFARILPPGAIILAV
jgi:hypothetical protein